MKKILIFIFLQILSLAYANQYLKLPDGTYYEVKDGVSALDATVEAQRKYPEAYGLFRIDEEKKYDAEWFNDCKQKAAKEVHVDNAMIASIQACKFKAVPKKCRAYQITNDRLGNEVGKERIQCIEDCKNANIYSKTFGECSKG